MNWPTRIWVVLGIVWATWWLLMATVYSIGFSREYLQARKDKRRHRNV